MRRRISRQGSAAGSPFRASFDEVLRKRDVVLRKHAAGYSGDEHTGHERVQLVRGHVGGGECEAQGKSWDYGRAEGMGYGRFKGLRWKVTHCSSSSPLTNLQKFKFSVIVVIGGNDRNLQQLSEHSRLP